MRLPLHAEIQIGKDVRPGASLPAGEYSNPGAHLPRQQSRLDDEVSSERSAAFVLPATDESIRGIPCSRATVWPELAGQRTRVTFHANAALESCRIASPAALRGVAFDKGAHVILNDRSEVVSPAVSLISRISDSKEMHHALQS